MTGNGKYRTEGGTGSCWEQRHTISHHDGSTRFTAVAVTMIAISFRVQLIRSPQGSVVDALLRSGTRNFSLESVPVYSPHKSRPG